jgi:hypothetical protein
VREPISIKMGVDSADDRVEIPEGMGVSEGEAYVLMVKTAKALLNIPNALSGTLAVVLKTDPEGHNFCPMIVNFISCKEGADVNCANTRSVVAMYVDQIASMVSDVQDGSLKSNFAEVLESAARAMRDVDAPMKGFLSN